MHQETPVLDTADTAPTQALPPSAALFQMITGKFVSRAVYAAARLRLADLLAEEPRTAADLAASTGNHAPSLRRLLRALAGLGVFATVPRSGRGLIGRRRRLCRPRPGARGGDALRTSFDQQYRPKKVTLSTYMSRAVNGWALNVTRTTWPE
jgi:Dimerisation domain